MWPGYDAHMGWVWLWWIVGLGLLALFVWAVARATGRPSPRGGDSPEAILKRRYARDGVDRKAYERTLTGLRK